MYEILKIIVLLYILSICMRFVKTDETNNLTQSTLNGTFSSKNISTTGDEKITDDLSEYSHEHIAVQKWRQNDAVARKTCVKIYNKILPYLTNGSKDLDLSPKCKRALMRMLIGLKQYKLWAFQMFDSSAKISPGILNLDAISLGNYDECLSVNGPGSFQGQYCNVEIRVPLPEREPFSNPYTLMPEFENFSRSVAEDSVTADILKKLRFSHYRAIRTALCVPSTCSKYEVERLANKVLQSMKFNADVTVPNCDILEEGVEFSSGEIAIMTVLGILLLFCITSTVVDVYLKLMSEDDNYQENLSLPIKYLLCFSVYTNLKHLCARDISVDSIKIFHGMRVFSILWIMLGHMYGYQLLEASAFSTNVLKYSQEFAFQIILQGFTAVDTFFFISAAVHSYGIMKFKDVKTNYCLHILKRILRLAIPFSFVMLCVFLVPYIGSGPVWKETIESLLTRKCRDKWWINILFINNFFSWRVTCLKWFWYIPVDTHLFLLSLLVIIPMRSNPRLAFAINVFIFLGGVCISQIFSFYYGYIQIPTLGYGHADDFNDLLEKEYKRTYEHCTSCCVGLVVGYFLATRSFKLKIPLKINLALWLSAFLLGMVVTFGMYGWNQFHIPNIFLCMLYKSTKRLWWSLALAWVTISCMTGNGGIVTKILSWPGFVTLARLTYMVYLVHPIVLFVYLGSTRTLVEVDHRSLVFMYFGNVVVSYMCAFVCSLLFELPFTALQNLIFSSFKQKDLQKAISSSGIKKDMPDVSKYGRLNTEDHFSDRNEEISASDFGSLGYSKFQ